MLSPLSDRYNNLDADPQTVKELDDFWIPVTPAMDNYMRGLLHLFNPGISAKEFMGFYWSLMRGDRAFTNGHGIESNNWAIETLICAGATLQAVDDTLYRGYREFRALDVNHIPSIPSSIEGVDFTLHFRPNTFTHIALPDGTTRVNPFPQFNGKTVFPIWSKTGSIWLPDSRLIPVADIQNPFHPMQ